MPGRLTWDLLGFIFQGASGSQSAEVLKTNPELLLPVVPLFCQPGSPPTTLGLSNYFKSKPQ